METALRSLIDWYERVGVDVPPLGPMRPKRPATHRTSKHAVTSKPQQSTPNRQTTQLGRNTDNNNAVQAARDAAQTAKTLDALNMAIRNFDAGRLSDNARQAVFARGNPAAKFMVIGEAPSAEDDAKGTPFMGREGELLSRMLGAIGLSEDDYYLTLAINWRLPQNLTPKPAEIDICRPFLTRHIELAAPSHILMLGSTPLSALTQMTGIMKHHGQWQTVKIGDKEIAALPIYHPAFLLNQADLKKDAWRDLLTLRAALDSTKTA